MRNLPGDFTRALDERGLVIYFSVAGRRMLFNGHAGTFYDTLPGWAQATLEAAVPAAIGARSTSRPGPISRSRAAMALRREIALFRSGRHPSLQAEARQAALENRGAPAVFNVFLAQGCNLRCRYCVNHRGTFGRRPAFMSRATAREVIRFLRDAAAATSEPTLRVNLLGGEPLLAADAAYEIARACRDMNRAGRGPAVRVILYTNGTIYEERVFRVLAERPDLCTVVVSLDGTAESHDRNRRFANSRGTFASVAGNIQRLMHDGIPCSVTCVVTKPYDYIGAAEALHRIGVTRLEMKDLIDHEYSGAEVPEDCGGDFDMWRNQYLAYTDFYLEHLKTDRPAMHIDRYAVVQEFGRVLNGSDGFHRTLGCGLADEKVGITADGRIVPCEGLIGRADLELGNVGDGFDAEKLARFEERLLAGGQLRLDHERCRACFAKRLCGGGCYAPTLEQSNSFAPCDESRCRFVREKARIDLYFLARLKAEQPRVFAAFGGVID